MEYDSSRYPDPLSERDYHPPVKATRFERIIGAFPRRYSNTREYLGELIDHALSEGAKDILSLQAKEATNENRA